LIKARSKKISFVLVIAMLMTMFAFAGSASAATTYSVVTAPTVVKATTSDLGSVLINIDVLEGKTAPSAFLVTLPKDFEFSTTMTDYALTVSKNDDEKTATNAWFKGQTVGTATKLNDREIRVDVLPVTDDGLISGNALDYDDVRLSLALKNVVIPSDADEGAIEATFTAISGQFPGAEVTVGKIPAGAVTVSVLDKVTLELGGIETVQITVQEDSKAGLEAKADTLRFRLPKGFEWTTPATVTNVGVATVDTLTAAVDGTDSRYLNINRTGTADPKSIYRVTADIRVADEDEAKLGDIDVNVSGKSSYSPSSFNIGTYADFGYTITVEDSDTAIIAGKTGEDAELSPFRIKEAVRGTLINNRTVIMELPDGVHWDTVDTSNKAGNLNLTGLYIYPNSLNKARMTVTNTGSAGDVKVEGKVRVAVNYTGPITIKFSGSAGINDEITVGEVTAPITATADPVNVIIGSQDQPGADIVITETEGEALVSGQNLVLRAPAGVSFSKLPTVTAEDLTVGTVTRAAGPDGTRNNELVIPIRSQSDNGGTITISNVYYSIDRTVAEGPMNVIVIGGAVDQANITNRTVAATVTAAYNVTAAGGVEAYTASFVIGSSTYVLNGAEYTMDVAPYIKDARTYMPIRYVAYALGINDNNILWDQANKTVTLMKGDKVVQLQIGSKAIVINGAAVTMDVAPEISSDRTMLPARFVAQAFGADVDWDEATQTVTIN